MGVARTVRGMALALVLACALPAAAPAAWTPPQDVSDHGALLAAWAAPKVAVGLDGTAAVIWREGCCAAEALMVSIRPPGGTFGPARMVNPPDDDKAEMGAVAVTATGEVVVAWARLTDDPDTTGLAVATARAGEDFGAPRMLAAPNGDEVQLFRDEADGLHVAYGRDGVAPRVLHRPAGGDWKTTPAPPGVADGDAVHTAFAVSGDGSAVFAWQPASGGGLRARTRSGPSGAWTEEKLLEPAGEAGNGPGWPKAVGGPGSRLGVRWLSRVSDSQLVERMADGTPAGFGPAQDLVPFMSDLDVGFAPSGAALMACRCLAEGLGVRERASGAGTWGAMQQATPAIGTTLGGEQGPKVAFDAAGAAHVAWNGYTTELRQSAAVVSSRAPGGSWTAPVAASPTAGWVIGRDIAAGRAGDVVVAWTYVSPRRTGIQVAQSTDAPPPPPPAPPALQAQPSAPHTGMVQGTPFRNGRLKGSGLKAPLEPAWIVGNDSPMGSVPAADGRVLTYRRSDAGVDVVALDVDDGRELWARRVSDKPWDHPLLALLGDGVYVGLWDRVTMLEADDGAERWSVGVAGSSQPALVDGEILASWWGSGATLVALDPATGARRWRLFTGMAGGWTVAGRGMAFFGQQCEPLGVDLGTREWAWNPNAACSSQHASQLVFDGDWLWGAGAPEGRIHQWTDGDAVRALKGGMPAFAEPYGYRVIDGRMVAFDPRTLDEKWSAPLPGPAGTAPLVADDLVLVATRSGVVLAFDRLTGAELWRGDAGGKLAGDAPQEFALGVADGHLIVPTLNGLTAFRVDPSPDPVPLTAPPATPSPERTPSKAGDGAPLGGSVPTGRAKPRPVVLRRPVLDRRGRVVVRVTCRVPCRGRVTAGGARRAFGSVEPRAYVVRVRPLRWGRVPVVVRVYGPDGRTLRKRAWVLRAR